MFKKKILFLRKRYSESILRKGIELCTFVYKVIDVHTHHKRRAWDFAVPRRTRSVDPCQIIGRLIFQISLLSFGWLIFQVSLLPIDLSGPISIQGTGLSKIDCAKQMLDVHEDPSFEEKNGEGLKLYVDVFYYGTEVVT